MIRVITLSSTAPLITLFGVRFFLKNKLDVVPDNVLVSCLCRALLDMELITEYVWVCDVGRILIDQICSPPFPTVVLWASSVRSSYTHTHAHTHTHTHKLITISPGLNFASGTGASWCVLNFLFNYRMSLSIISLTSLGHLTMIKLRTKYQGVQFIFRKNAHNNQWCILWWLHLQLELISHLIVSRCRSGRWSPQIISNITLTS